MVRLTSSSHASTISSQSTLSRSTGLSAGETMVRSAPLPSPKPRLPQQQPPTPTIKTTTRGVALFRAKSMTAKEALNYIGFANIPHQIFRRSLKQGFEFTLMVVGQSGLGKSTFINTLFSAEINDPAIETVGSDGSTTIPSTELITVRTMQMQEDGVILNLTLVDTPGFGDFVDNSKCWDPIVEFIERQYQGYFSEETKIVRLERIPDRRVHLCLYFIAPTGHGLKQLDIEFMRRLNDRVNIIPIIAKADTLTRPELDRFKKRIMSDMSSAGIKAYNGPKPAAASVPEYIPFAVVGSNTMLEGPTPEAGRIRYREYPWGTVEVDNMGHNDFLALRDMIIRDPLTQLEQERRLRQRDLDEKMNNMEKIHLDQMSIREAILTESEKRLEDKEREQQNGLDSRQMHIETLQTALRSLRPAVPTASVSGSRWSVNSTHTTGHSPPAADKSGRSSMKKNPSKTDEKEKKKEKEKRSMMGGLFGM